MGDTRGMQEEDNSTQEQPEAAKSIWEQPGRARSRQGQLRATRDSQEQPKQPGEARSSQKRNPRKRAQKPPNDPWEEGGSKKTSLLRNSIKKHIDFDKRPDLENWWSRKAAARSSQKPFYCKIIWIRCSRPIF